jgi:hypothetical protein
MKKTLNFVITTIAVAACLDFLILCTALLQLGIEGRTGEWNAFWIWQAQKLVQLLEYVSH